MEVSVLESCERDRVCGGCVKYEPHCDLRRLGREARHAAAYQRRREQALRYCVDAFSAEPGPAYIAVSGGKDSVALASVVEQAAAFCSRTVTLWCHVSDASFPGTRETVEALAERLALPLVIDESPVSAFAVVGKQSRREFGKQGFFFDAIGSWLDRSGCRLAFIGVRAAESKRRTAAAEVHGAIFPTSVPRPHLKCQPLTWWGVADVAAELVSRELPIHPVYDRLPVNGEGIRLGYVTALDLMHKGTVVFLKMNYFQLYNRLVGAFPEAAQYT